MRSTVWLIVLLSVASWSLEARRLNLNTLTKEASSEVVKCVQDAKGLDANYRAKCIDLLSRWKSEKGKEAIEGVLKRHNSSSQQGAYSSGEDTTAQVRVAACYALGEFQDKESVPILANTLKKDRNSEVRVAAAYALQLFDSELSVDGLVDALLMEIQKEDKASLAVVRQVVRSLGKLQHKKAFIPLLKATQVGFPNNIKEEAQKAMDKIDWQKSSGSSS